MKEYVAGLINKHKKNGALLDANLALLLLVGQVDRKHISSFKRTSKYTAADYQALVDVPSNFKTIVTTPNVLTEFQLHTTSTDECCELTIRSKPAPTGRSFNSNIRLVGISDRNAKIQR